MKKRISIISLILIFAIAQLFLNIIAKAEGNEFLVTVAVNSFDKPIAYGKATNSNALQAVEEVLMANKLSYKVTEASWGGRYISEVAGIQENSFKGYDGWLYTVVRDGKYMDIATSIDTFTLKSGDKLLLYYGDFSTLLINKLSFSTSKEKEALEIFLNNTYVDFNSGKTVTVPVIGLQKVVIDNKEYTVTENKINISEGLNYGKHIIEINDFKIDKCPIAVSDKIEFEFNSTINIVEDKANDNKSDNLNIKKDIDKEIKELKKYIEANFDDPWAALTLQKFDIKAKDTFIKESAENISKVGIKNYSNTDLEKLILNLTALGYNPYNFLGIDLIDELLNRNEEDLLINDVAFALFVYNYTNAEDKYNLSKDKLINFILKNIIEYTDKDKVLYGWTLAGSKINPDITGIVLSALAPYNSEKYPQVQLAIQKSINSLSFLQNESGYLSDNFGSFSESLSFVIVGLTAVGENPEGDKFNKAKGDLISALLSFKGSENQYKHNLEGNNNYMATEQALRAFYSINEYKKFGKYDFYKSTIDAKSLPQYGYNLKPIVLPTTGAIFDSRILLMMGILTVLTGIYMIQKQRERNN